MPIIQDCLICRQTSYTLICAYCQQDLPQFNQDNKNLMLWPPIAKGLQKVDFEYLLALADYQWPLSHLLTGLKFSAKLTHAKALAELFVEQNTHCTRPEAIVPIPLHNNRYFLRKYNQSLEISQHLSRLTHIPMAHQLLQRHKNTQAQTTLSANQRRHNLRNAFVVPASYHSRLKKLQHIALFDDVVTTGTTVNAAYLALKQIHPQLQIDIWCICVALQH